MLAISFFDLHVQGGMMFMAPLSMLFIINIGIFAYVLLAVIQKKQFNAKWLEAIKQTGGLAAAWGTWSTIFGLFQAFDAIEASADVIPFPVICGGLKVASLTVLYGLIIFCLSLLSFIILKLSTNNATS